jgi:hypothetical protein
MNRTRGKRALHFGRGSAGVFCLNVICENDMKITRIILPVFFLILFFAATGSSEEPNKKSCKEHPTLSGPCFKVRGRMSFFNGNPSARIWPVGTKRMLGISEGRFYLDDYVNVPDELVRQISWETAMFADFTVCPFTDDRPGEMRMICVESADNISIRKWR